MTNPGKISDYNGKVIQNPIPPLAAIPSTAGTGSEVTQFTIISDTKNQIKMLLKGSVLLPDIAVVDPQFTMSTPKSVTAATGLDGPNHYSHMQLKHIPLKRQPHRPICMRFLQ